MSIVTSDKPFLERVKESEQDKLMQASVAKAQDAQWDKREASRTWQLAAMARSWRTDPPACDQILTGLFRRI